MAAEAVAPGSDYLQANYLVEDIGSKTTDVILLWKGLPVESRSITVEREMVKWMKQILTEYFSEKDRGEEWDDFLKQFHRECLGMRADMEKEQSVWH